MTWAGCDQLLRGHLPDTYEIIHNLEIKQDKEVFEIDLVLLAPQCVFVVDIKGTHGHIGLWLWHPEIASPTTLQWQS